MGAPRKDLTEKHWQALKLIEAGELSRKDIAAKMGWTSAYFVDMCNGNIQNIGYTADLFKKEIEKIETKRDGNIKTLVKENIETAQTLIRRTLKELKSKKRLSHEEKKLLGTLNNSLNKSTPSVSIKSLSYSYTKGLTAEELIHEFSRLRSIAESSFDKQMSLENEQGDNPTIETGSFDGGRVQEAVEGGSGSISGANEPGSRLAQDS